METKSLTVLALAGLAAVRMAAPVQADDPGEDSNLFKSPGANQSAKDCKPAADKMETKFGTLEFEGFTSN